MTQKLVKTLFGKKENNSDNVAQAGESLLLHVTDNDFEKKVLQSDLPVLVDFWAEWCMPCRMVGPIVAELAHDYEGRAVIAKIDTDHNPQTPGSYGIMGIPTLILFKNGQEIERVVGVRPKAALAQMLNKVIEK